MVDRISELPDDVVGRILSFLTVKDAFQAKLLSRRWRRLQVPLSNLYFNQTTIFGFEYCDSWFPEKKHLDFLATLKCEFVEGVDRFLKRFRGPYLNSFMLCFCLDNEFASHIDNWVAFAIRMKAESIELNFDSILQSDKYQLYDFPFHLLLSGSGKGSRLKHLSLKACRLRPPPPPEPRVFANQLNSLKTLDLQKLPLDQTAFETVLSTCLDLHWLILIECQLPVAVRISGRLKGFRVDWCEGFKTIELSSVHLQEFELRCRFKRVSFRDVPRLKRVFLGFVSPFIAGTDYIFKGLAKDLPELQMLSLFWFYNAQPIPATVTTFSCLKELDMYVHRYLDFNLLSVTYILNACPILQKFHMALSYAGHIERREEKVEYSNLKNLHCLQLEEIEISGFKGKFAEMELAIYLLNHTAALKRMTLFNSRRKTSQNSWKDLRTYRSLDELDEQQILDSLLKQMINPGIELIVL